MKVLRRGYVLFGVAAHVSNSLMGKMPDCIRMRTATLMMWVVEYRSWLMVWISWHCLI